MQHFLSFARLMDSCQWKTYVFSDQVRSGLDDYFQHHNLLLFVVIVSVFHRKMMLQLVVQRKKGPASLRKKMQLMMPHWYSPCVYFFQHMQLDVCFDHGSVVFRIMFILIFLTAQIYCLFSVARCIAIIMKCITMISTQSTVLHIGFQCYISVDMIAVGSAL